MAVGFPIDKSVIDARSGTLTLQLRDTLREIGLIKGYLDGKSDGDLQSLGYSPTEVTVLRAAVTDLDKLGRIANAQAVQADANDFFFWARNLTGLR